MFRRQRENEAKSARKDHYRVANLDFMKPNLPYLAFSRELWRQKKNCLAFWLFFHLNLAFFEAMERRNICLFRCFVKKNLAFLGEN